MMGLFLLGILPCYTPLQPAAHQAWLTGQHTNVRGRATTPRLVAIPPFDKPVCDMSNGELRKALSDFGVNRIDRIKFWFTRLTGKDLLATRKHELIQAGISLRGAGLMVELVEAVSTKGAPPPPARLQGRCSLAHAHASCPRLQRSLSRAKRLRCRTLRSSTAC
jgi:hypothetical protein